MTYLPDVDIRAAKSASTDAFGRWRVSNPASLYACTHTYDLNPLMWQTIVTGGGTAAHSGSRSGVTMEVASAGDRVIRQTYNYWQYQPGKSHSVKMTFVMGSPVPGVVRRVGYYDDNDGVVFQQGADGVLSFVLRSSVSGAPVDTLVAQSQWSEDTLDGFGPSGVVFDPAKAHILTIDLQYLGVGAVRVGFSIDGESIPVHEFDHANALGSVYMSTGSLPLRYEIEAVAAPPAPTSMEQICSEVASEGGWDTDVGIPFSANSGATAASLVGGSPRSILTLRPRATFGAKPNRGLLIPAAVEILNTGANPVLWETYYFSTSTGAVFADVDSTNSIAQVSTTQVAVSGGVKAGSGYLVPTSGVFKGPPYGVDIRNRLYLSLDYAGTSQREFCLAGTGVGGASAVYASIVWDELR